MTEPKSEGKGDSTLVGLPESPIDTADETEAEVAGRKANPLLERVLDEIQVAIDNLPLDFPESKKDRLVSLHSEVLSVAKANRPTKKDRDEQDKREAEAKKPK